MTHRQGGRESLSPATRSAAAYPVAREARADFRGVLLALRSGSDGARGGQPTWSGVPCRVCRICPPRRPTPALRFRAPRAPCCLSRDPARHRPVRARLPQRGPPSDRQRSLPPLPSGPPPALTALSTEIATQANPKPWLPLYANTSGVWRGWGRFWPLCARTARAWARAAAA